MNVSQINREYKLFKDLLSRGIENVYQECVRNCKSKFPQEPDYIAFLSLNLPPILYHILKLLFPKQLFSVSGVYCHQKPLADFGTTPTPEIGDILFVYTHTNENGSVNHNSLLFQAKRSTYGYPTKISSREEHQLKLYADWPKFKLRRADEFNGEEFDIQPKLRHDGAQYLILGKPSNILYQYFFSLESKMNCARPSERLWINNSLEEELIDFLKFKAGRPIERESISSQDDWTKLIWNILRVVKDKVSKRQNVGLRSFPRMATEKADGLMNFVVDSGVNSFFKEHQKVFGMEDQDVEEWNIESKDEERAPAIILIESRDPDE